MKSLEERLWPKVDKNGPLFQATPCWIWTACCGTGGYGQFSLTPIGANKRITPAHRVIYELLVNPIPNGLTLDHLCKRRNCVNPEHLEPVTLRVNILRGNGIGVQNAHRTYCKRGHALIEENMYTWPKTSKYRGKRTCKLCHKINNKTHKQRKRQREKEKLI